MNILKSLTPKVLYGAFVVVFVFTGFIGSSTGNERAQALAILGIVLTSLTWVCSRILLEATQAIIGFMASKDETVGSNSDEKV